LTCLEVGDDQNSGHVLSIRCLIESSSERFDRCTRMAHPVIVIGERDDQIGP
jgi:hypothetical protein